MNEKLDLRDLYATCAGRLVAQVYAMTGDFAEAQDVVQETFAKVLARPNLLRRVDNPEAWLRRVALNAARSRHRRRAILDRILRSGRLRVPEALPPVTPDRVAVVTALQRLPRPMREVLVLHHLADLPVAEVAAALDCNVGAVKVRLVRARRALAEELRDDDREKSNV